jgi:hypothetical protein
VNLGIDIHAMTLSSFELHGNRCGELRTSLHSVNDVMSSYSALSTDLTL